MFLYLVKLQFTILLQFYLQALKSTAIYMQTMPNPQINSLPILIQQCILYKLKYLCERKDKNTTYAVSPTKINTVHMVCCIRLLYLFCSFACVVSPIYQVCLNRYSICGVILKNARCSFFFCHLPLFPYQQPIVVKDHVLQFDMFTNRQSFYHCP